MESKRIGILISGRGSNMVSIIKATKERDFPGEVVIVISNIPDAHGLRKAEERNIKTAVINHKDYSSRVEFDCAVAAGVDEYKVDLVCLAGFMRLLSSEFVQKYKNRLMNIHPSLLPAFPGLHAQKQAVEWGAKVSGCTVHFVDEDLDHGPIILQEAVKVEDDDTEESLSERILKVEHKIYPEAVKLFCQNRLTVRGRKVYISQL